MVWLNTNFGQINKIICGSPSHGEIRLEKTRSYISNHLFVQFFNNTWIYIYEKIWRNRRNFGKGVSVYRSSALLSRGQHSKRHCLYWCARIGPTSESPNSQNRAETRGPCANEARCGPGFEIEGQNRGENHSITPNPNPKNSKNL